MGLPPFQTPTGPDEAFRYLEMPAAERRKLTPVECADACIAIARFGAHVGRLCQQEEADAFLLDERITEIVRDHVHEQPAYTPFERRALAIAGNIEAAKLERARIAAVAKAKRLAYWASRYEKIARGFENLSNARRRDREYGD